MRRLATEPDLRQVYRIYMDPAVVPFLGYDPMPLADFRAVYDALLAGGGFHVHEIDGQVAGFYNAQRYAGRARHVASLGTLAVAPAFHGHGVAHAMVSTAIARLRADGVLRIELFVESDNGRALAFYQRLGFEIEGRMRKFYKRAHEAAYVDDYIMGLLL